ncbi:MAG TPA: hypothetical protein DEA82_00745 [Flavobacteriaceae bacterium]|nr:hypothetical protein [Flavobacteriaceae bacterium]|tara:strand:- start:183 stop:422 length:240 start_codon:yes stop_codon:yes gene_type:complete
MINPEKKIREFIVKINNLAIKEAPKPEDQLLFCASMVSVVRNLYLNNLGVEQTNIIFEQLSASFQMMEDFYPEETPTIH